MAKQAHGSRKHLPKGIRVVYEDDDLLVVDKAPGLLTVATDKEKTRTVYHHLTDYVRKGNPKSRNRVFIVHRLDRETSGLLVFAKSYGIKERLQENWDAAEKTYLALVQGVPRPSQGTITSYLWENKAHVVASTQDTKRGKFARTDYRVLRTAGKVSLVELRILTGRKHQIRVHLAEAGHPVLGDRKYGPRGGGKRMALHATALAFPDPRTGAPLRFEAETPPLFARLAGDSAAEATKDENVP